MSGLKLWTLTAVVSFSLGAHAVLVDKIVAIVNDQIVTLSDVHAFQARLKSGGLTDEALAALTDAKKLSQDPKSVLNYLVDERIMDSEIKKKKLEVTIERVEQEIRNIAHNNNITRDQLEEALAAKGVSIAEYQDFIKKSLERQSLIDSEIKSKIRISDEDISSYYLSNEGHSGSEIFQYTLSHIMFNPKNGGWDAALARAKDVLSQLKDGESFEKLAGQYSEDPNFSKGGLLGTFKAGEMQKTIEAAVRNVSPGDATGIIKLPDGYHIVKVDSRTLISDPQLNEQKDKIRATLYAQAFKRQFRIWLTQHREESFIRINGL